VRPSCKDDRGCWLSCCLALGLLLLQPQQLSASDPAKRLSQLGHTAWRLQDGLFNGAPTVMAQTADGYLWIGTRSGLLRFDGVRFTPWTPPQGSSFPGLDVVTLLGASDGSLWVGASRGLGRISGSQASMIEPFARINGLVQDKDGAIWYGRARIDVRDGSLCRVVQTTTQCFGEKNGLTVGRVTALAVDPLNSIWIGGTGTLARWKSGVATNYALPGLKSAVGLEGVQALASDGKADVLVALKRTGSGLGLQSVSDGKARPYVRNNFKGGDVSATCLLRDHDGGLWIGTTSDGVYRVTDSSVDHYTSSDGLSGDSVNHLFEDREGDVWVATTGGIDRFRDARVVTFSVKQGLKADAVSSIAAGQDNRVWIGNFGALQSWQNGKISTITAKDGLPGERVTSLFEDHAGTLWVGVDDQLYTYDHKRFGRIKTSFNQSLGVVVGMKEDAAHDMWAVVSGSRSPQGLVKIRDRKVSQDTFSFEGEVWTPLAVTQLDEVFARRFDSKNMFNVLNSKSLLFPHWDQGRARVSLHDIAVDRNGRYWAASTIGLVGWDGTRTETLSMPNGLPCDRVNTLIFDRHQDLWLSSECGYVRISQADLDASWSSAHPKLYPQLLSAADGAQPAAATFAPQSTMSTDGKLWFATETFVQMIDPERLVTNKRPPPVYIEQVVADHRVYARPGSLQLPANTRDIEINFAGLSFVAPEKVRFKYRLDGWDTEWQDSAGRRQAFYTNLRPKAYTFHVIAANNDGVWNATGATIIMVIQPAYYQTTWFIAVVSVFVLFLLYLSYLARLHQVTGQIKAGIAERAAERERIALDLHDTFFQGIQGLLLRFNAGTSMLKADEPARAIFIETLEQSDRVMLEGRELVLDLQRDTTDAPGFPESLAKLAEGFSGQPKADFTIFICGATRTLQPAVLTEINRIAKEALTNAFTHAGPAKIEVEVKYEHSAFVLVVRDSGVGIDDQVLTAGRRAGHLGLPGMQNRAKKIDGSLTVRSRRGAGTEIELCVPAYIAYADVDRRHTRFADWIWRTLRFRWNGGRNDRDKANQGSHR
jgi:ligand-binding sensor domain-containing protein/signal transduction histidine kinase